MNNLFIFENAISSVDKKTLNVFLVIFVILFFILAGIGTLIRVTMQFQAKRANGFMANVYSTGIINNEKDYRKFGNKKNWRKYFRQATPGILIFACGVLVWVIAGWITKNFNKHIFEETKDLLFLWDFDNPDHYTKVFGIKLLAEFPELIQKPHIENEHILSYVEVILMIIGIVWYLVATQAFISRGFKIFSDSKSLFVSDVQEIKKAKDAAMAQATIAPPLPPVD